MSDIDKIGPETSETVLLQLIRSTRLKYEEARAFEAAKFVAALPELMLVGCHLHYYDRTFPTRATYPRLAIAHGKGTTAATISVSTHHNPLYDVSQDGRLLMGFNNTCPIFLPGVNPMQIAGGINEYAIFDINLPMNELLRRLLKRVMGIGDEPSTVGSFRTDDDKPEEETGEDPASPGATSVEEAAPDSTDPPPPPSGDNRTTMTPEQLKEWGILGAVAGHPHYMDEEKIPDLLPMELQRTDDGTPTHMIYRREKREGAQPVAVIHPTAKGKIRLVAIDTNGNIAPSGARGKEVAVIDPEFDAAAKLLEYLAAICTAAKPDKRSGNPPAIGKRVAAAIKRVDNNNE